MARFLLCALAFLNFSCVKDLIEPNRDFDSHKIKIQMLSLFNQRTNPKNSTKTWRGDWLFRRERLSVIDRELSELKPDLAIFQKMMKRDSNSFESDQGILSAGALKGYKWRASKIREYSDTGEEESLGLALSSPLEFLSNEEEQSTVLGASSLALQTLKLEKQPILLANLEIDNAIVDSQFGNIVSEVKRKIASDKICSQRLIFAISASPELEERIMKLSEIFELQDSAKGFCNTESACYTANSVNQIFDLVYGEILPRRVDFLLVSRSASIRMSEPNMKEPKQTELTYFKQFGLDSLWASDRYGWKAELTLARCQR